MKTKLGYILIFLCVTISIVMPVSALVPGNVTGVQTVGAIQTSFPTYAPTALPTFVPPTMDIPQNIGIVPIWLIFGIILIIIAIAGLVWRYLHPKYVPKDKNE